MGDLLDEAGLRDHEAVWCAHLEFRFTAIVRPPIPLHDWQIRLNASEFLSFCSQKAHSILSFDGAAKRNPGRSEAGGVVKNVDGVTVLRYAWGVVFNTSIQA